MLVLLCAPNRVQAQVDSVRWDFTSGTLLPATDLTWAPYTCTPLSASNTSSINSTTASSGYAGASGGNNLALTAPLGVLNTSSSSYVQLTLTPDNGKQVALTQIAFGVRSTATGAQSWCLRSSADGYAFDLAAGAISNNSAWSFKSAVLNLQAGVGNAVTLRLYFYGGVGGSAGANNTRLDDIKLRMSPSVATPKLSITPKSLQFTTAVGVPGQEVFTVQGRMLEQNVSISSTNPKFSVDKASIDFAQANASRQTVTVTFDGSANATGKIVVKSYGQGADVVDTVRVSATVSTTAGISVDVSRLDFPLVMVGGRVTLLVKVTGNSLSDSISVTLPANSAFTASAGKLHKSVSEAYLFIYYHPLVEEVVSDELQLSCPGVATVRLPITARSVYRRTDLLPPAGYYDGAKEKTGATLKTALYNTIKGHSEITYDNIWVAFRSLDVRPECDEYMPDPSVWDIYTDRPGCLPDNSPCTPGYANPAGRCAGFKVLRMGSDQTGTGGSNEEGVSYEREHTFPKGWWAASGERQSMYRDLFHIYPCDHRVNNLRNDNPYGEVNKAASTTFTNGSQLGTSTTSGSHTGAVYEPIDEYKGDVARNYFYMVTRYENTVQHWSKNVTWGGSNNNDVVGIAPGLHANASPMIDTNAYPVFKPWAQELLLKWHRLDPVSEKEQMRNQGIYATYQNNRNPFIDNPELVEYIWGDSVGSPWKGVPLPLSITADSIRYAGGAFDVAVWLANVQSGVKSVNCFLGNAPGDTTLAKYSMAYDGQAYRAAFTPAFSFDTLYFTFVARDAAANSAVRYDTFIRRVAPPLQVDTTAPVLVLDTLFYEGNVLDATARAVDVQSGVRRVMLYAGKTEGDTTQAKYVMGLAAVANTYTLMVSTNFNFLPVFFTITASDSAGNKSAVRYRYNGAATGILRQPVSQIDFLVYPNPARSEVYVQLKNFTGMALLELFNSEGVRVKMQKTSEAESKIGLGELPTGIYFVRVSTAKGSATRAFTYRP